MVCGRVENAVNDIQLCIEAGIHDANSVTIVHCFGSSRDQPRYQRRTETSAPAMLKVRVYDFQHRRRNTNPHVLLASKGIERLLCDARHDLAVGQGAEHCSTTDSDSWQPALDRRQGTGRPLRPSPQRWSCFKRCPRHAPHRNRVLSSRRRRPARFAEARPGGASFGNNETVDPILCLLARMIFGGRARQRRGIAGASSSIEHSPTASADQRYAGPTYRRRHDGTVELGLSGSLRRMRARSPACSGAQAADS